MYKKILVTLNNSPNDQPLLNHITELANIHHSELLLVHVADGWAARYYDELLLRPSEEMIKDEKYLHGVAEQLRSHQLNVHVHLAKGEPAGEILRLANEKGCDLIAMTSQGHSHWTNLFLGSTIETVRDKTTAPLLIIHDITFE